MEQKSTGIYNFFQAVTMFLIVCFPMGLYWLGANENYAMDAWLPILWAFGIIGELSLLLTLKVLSDLTWLIEAENRRVGPDKRRPQTDL